MSALDCSEEKLNMNTAIVYHLKYAALCFKVTMAKQQPNGWLNMLWVHFPSQPILIGLSNCIPHPPVHRLPGIRRIYIYIR